MQQVQALVLLHAVGLWPGIVKVGLTLIKLSILEFRNRKICLLQVQQLCDEDTINNPKQQIISLETVIVIIHIMCCFMDKQFY